MAEIKLVSAVTLRDVLAPFEFVDYLDSDIQQSEIIVFPPFLDLLKRKVRRIHIGTHGKDVHRSLHELFRVGRLGDRVQLRAERHARERARRVHHQ